MSAIAIIHAHGGSKRIPLKNLCELNGKPLIAYPIDDESSVPQNLGVGMPGDRCEGDSDAAR